MCMTETYTKRHTDNDEDSHSKQNPVYEVCYTESSAINLSRLTSVFATLYLYLSVLLSARRSACMALRLSVFSSWCPCLPACLSVCVSMFQSVYTCISGQYVYVCLCLSVCLHINVYVSVNACMSASVCLVSRLASHQWDDYFVVWEKS